MEFKSHRAKSKAPRDADIRVLSGETSSNAKRVVVMIRTADRGIFDPDGTLSMSPSEAISLAEQILKHARGLT